MNIKEFYTEAEGIRRSFALSNAIQYAEELKQKNVFYIELYPKTSFDATYYSVAVCASRENALMTCDAHEKRDPNNTYIIEAVSLKDAKADLRAIGDRFTRIYAGMESVDKFLHADDSNFESGKPL